VNRVCALIVVVVAALVGALRAANATNVPGDFLRYHRAGRLVATGRADLVYDEAFLARQSVYADERVPGAGDLTELEFKYAPALAVMMAPLGALPPRAASIVWGAWNEALLATMFVVLWTWCGAGLSAWWILVPIAVLWRSVDGNVRLGQLNPSAIVPATVAAWMLARGKDRVAGALVGFGTVVKFMPAVFALWLLAKRKWAAFATFVGTVVLVGVALPAAALGPSKSAALTKEWIDQRAHHYTDAASPDLPGYSVKSFVYRAFGGTPFITFDGDDRARILIGEDVLAPATLRVACIVVDVLLIAAALWFALRAKDPRGPPAAALMFAAIPLVSPEARFPHFAYLALPLTALVCALAKDGISTTRRRVALALLVVGSFALNATASFLSGHDGGLLAEAWCAPGWGALVLGAGLVVVMTDPAPPRQSALP
jgi:hypothetical protein